MSARLISIYEGTRQDARHLGTLRLRWAARRARHLLAADRFDPGNQVRVVALEQELRARGQLRTPSLPQRPDGERRPVRRVPVSMVDRFRRIL